jgi:hypothetical protein
MTVFVVRSTLTSSPVTPIVRPSPTRLRIIPSSTEPAGVNVEVWLAGGVIAGVVVIVGVTPVVGFVGGAVVAAGEGIAKIGVVVRLAIVVTLAAVVVTVA